MYTRKGDDRLCNLNPLHPILCALFIFIHIIDCGYLVESFNDAHEKKKTTKNGILQLIKRLMLNFLGQLSTGRNTERGGYFCQCPRLRFNSIDLKNLVHTFLLEHTEYGFYFKS